VRLKAAALLRTDLGEAGAEPVRPAPLRHPVEFFESAPLLHAAYSPHAFIDTRYGAIEIELDVVLAPLTSMNFVELARAGFFSGMKIHRVVPNFVVQAGDPRGDGIGGPGYAIRDELSPQPFLRGTVGMALDGTDTGGSQFFISVSPQPYLDGKYTVFGRVVKGMEILDQISQGDVIDQVRIWDGVK
jgi:cyclophilin family peptidyl-prolyl cis-trans isomerase